MVNNVAKTGQPVTIPRPVEPDDSTIYFTIAIEAKRSGTGGCVSQIFWTSCGPECEELYAALRSQVSVDVAAAVSFGRPGGTYSHPTHYRP